jgi:steroid 5-alpha reductase family enzyme
VTRELRVGFAWIALAYAVAGGAAYLFGLYWAVRDMPPLVVAFFADVLATVVIFGFSFAFGNSSFYDAYWSIAPIPIAIYWGVQPESVDGSFLRQLLVITLVTIWGCRLTYNWARGWTGLQHEDWRYIDIKAKSGRAYWPVSFAGIHMMPTIWVFLGCLPLYPAMYFGRAPFGLLDVAATLVTGGAIWLEATADRQLLEFRAGRPSPEAVLDTGVWGWSRHPNYFGEMSYWWGLWIFGCAAAPESWRWTLLGAVSITFMFRFVSLPLIERRMVERRPAFAELQARTSLVVPRPPTASAEG